MDARSDGHLSKEPARSCSRTSASRPLVSFSRVPRSLERGTRAEPISHCHVNELGRSGLLSPPCARPPFSRMAELGRGQAECALVNRPGG